MGTAYSYAAVGGLANFTVTKSNPSGMKVRFTISDSANKLTSKKMIRSVLVDAINQWVAAERADLNANGDSAVAGSDTRWTGDGCASFDFNFYGKYAEVTLTALTSISSTGTLTVAIPYGDVI